MKLLKYNEVARENNINKSPSDTETQWWIEFLKGDDMALAQIYRKYSPKLFNYGRQFTANDILVQDAVQDVFFQLVDNRGSLGVAQSVKFYLFASFRRLLMRSLKKEKKYIGKEHVEEQGFLIMIDPDYYVVDGHLTDSQKKTLQNSCNELPVRQREIIIMRFFENMDYAEMAEIMGLANAKTVRTMLYRALNRLAEKLGPLKKEFFTF